MIPATPDPVFCGGFTDQGARAGNEDAYTVLDWRLLQGAADAVIAVADGMGGRAAGEVASSLVIKAVHTVLPPLLKGSTPVPAAIEACLKQANATVAAEGANGEKAGMGATGVVAVIVGARLYVGHVGDSRAYLWRNGELRQLTEDHSYVQEQVEAGVLTPDEARSSRFRSVITRGIGLHPDVEVDIIEEDWDPEAALLLCTDGISGVVTESAIASVLSMGTAPEVTAQELCELAIRRGSTDNVTAVVATGLGTEKEFAAPRRKGSLLLPLLFAASLAGNAVLLQRLNSLAKPAPPVVSAKLLPPAEKDFAPPRHCGYKIIDPAFLVADPSGGALVKTPGGSYLRFEPGGSSQLLPYAVLPPVTSAMTAARPTGYVVITAHTHEVASLFPDLSTFKTFAKASALHPTAIGCAPDGSLWLISSRELYYMARKSAPR